MTETHRQTTPLRFLVLALACLELKTSSLPVHSFATVSIASRSLPTTIAFLRSSATSDIVTTQNNDNDDETELLCAAVVIPGFLTGGAEFQSLCDELTKRGLPTVALPMPNWHWLPCLGGRSARPILERIDHTVQWLIANDGNITRPIPPYQYSLQDTWVDFRTNPGGLAAIGGSDKVDEYPQDVTPRGVFAMPLPLSSPSSSGNDRPKKKKKKKVALIGHSAGGWISRVYLSKRQYGGKVYDGSRYIHSLVTLGTPHANALGPAFEGISWVNREEQMKEMDGTPTVRCLAVAGTGFQGDAWGALTKGSYSFCCPDGTDGTQYDGDGITPIFSALALQDRGAEVLLLDGVSHFCWSNVFGGSIVAPELTKDHRQGRLWYGSPEVVDQWAPFILDHVPSCPVQLEVQGGNMSQ